MHWLIYMVSRFLARVLLSPFIRIRVIGGEETARHGACILAANHVSHFDPPVLSIAARRTIDWMAMTELFANRAVAAWLRSIDTFPVDRSRVDRLAVRTALDRLAGGRIVGMFPEGGIRDGDQSVLGGAPLRPGIGAIAQLSGARVLPCVILGTDWLYAPLRWIPFRRTTVWVAFGKPIHCEQAGKHARQAFEEELGKELRRLLAELQSRFGIQPDDLPQPAFRRKGREAIA